MSARFHPHFHCRSPPFTDFPELLPPFLLPSTTFHRLVLKLLRPLWLQFAAMVCSAEKEYGAENIYF